MSPQEPVTLSSCVFVLKKKDEGSNPPDNLVMFTNRWFVNLGIGSNILNGSICVMFIYIYIRFGSQVDKGIAWGLSPIKNFTPPPTPVGNLGYHFESVDSQRPWPP